MTFSVTCQIYSLTDPDKQTLLDIRVFDTDSEENMRKMLENELAQEKYRLVKIYSILEN